MDVVNNVSVNEMKELKRKQKLKKKIKVKEMLPLLIMLIPMVVYLLIFNYYPMLGLQIAFKDYRVKGGIWGSPWATTKGELDLFKHFKELFTDENFFKTFGNTLRISCLRLFVGFPIPIIITILLNEMPAKKYAKGYQIVSYLLYFLDCNFRYFNFINCFSKWMPKFNG